MAGAARARIARLTLTDFRSYHHAELAAQGRSCVLFGPNGAGKTNLLEAISLFSPGRGLRAAAAGELGRQAPGEAALAWAAAIEVKLEDGAGARLGTGVETAGGRRLARVDGQPAQISAFADHVRPLWLTPAHDRLFTGPASERRRFLDRLTFSGHPGHAADVAAYEHALRERLRLLAGGGADPVWLDALEAKAAEAGVRLAGARAASVEALAGEIDARRGGPFPVASLALSGEWMRLVEASAQSDLEARLAAELAASRRRDAAAGRTHCGPHRIDLAVCDRRSGRAAGQASTGEQKALILNLILAQAARLSRAISVPNPVLLLDEVAAHLDADRRAALFDEIEALSLQTFLTGADGTLFDSLAGRALAVRVDASRLTVLD